ncbi:kinase-like protein [Aspergillus sclerotiicarbonarius CBS 121057]|uniref:Kinase-like protein n=1 Tax=Aspergillus sclerotiicarbonarius (strain CBS 121057 / IBT 28362) TaxID=1448318 RepID=A0A319F719_ASPSB|nr:kinase-like protein [Aspergillus sclerotiicarbonarius CBS 121057]
MAHENRICHRAKSTLLSIRLWIGNRLFGTVGPHGVRISRHRLIKGPCESGEVAALKYVAEHTSIPVPKVLKVHNFRDALYIELEYIEGDDLNTAWRCYLSPEQKQQILAELGGYMSQLRSLEPPQTGLVASASLESCIDYRVGQQTFGPFDGHADFHSFLRGYLPVEDCTDVFGQKVTDCHVRSYRSCFAHADLCPRNIIVKDGKVAAIIDWACGGWYPEYWEYTKAHYGQCNMPDWYEGLASVIGRYDDELHAERLLWKLCDEPATPMIIARDH